MSADEFVEELRIQSLRDLEEAKFIIENSNRLEHVAWFCEQSYEKLVRHLYTRYTLQIQNRDLSEVYSTLYGSQHYETPHAVLGMLTVLAREFFQVYMSKFGKLPNTAENVLSRYPAWMDDEYFKSMTQKIDACLRDKDEFASLLKNSSHESLNQTTNNLGYAKFIEEYVSKYAQGTPGISGINALPAGWMAGPNLYKGYYFLTNLIILAPWILPHAFASRYPLMEAGFANLKLYRELEGQLRPYFVNLVSILASLHEQSDLFFQTFSNTQKPSGVH